MLLGVLGYYVWTFGTLDGFVETIDHCEQIFCDFSEHFYPVGERIFVEKRAVVHFVYPPFAAILFGFLGWFEYSTARLLWGVCQGALVVALFLLAKPNPRRDGAALTLAYLFVFLTSIPLLHNSKWGQVSVGLTVSVLGCFYLYERGFAVAAALLLAAGVAIKVYPVIFLPYFLLRRDFRFLAAFALGALAFLGVTPLVVLGWDATVSFHREVVSVIEELTPGFLERWNTQYAPAALSRMIWGRFSPDSVEARALAAASYALALLNFAGLYLVHRRSIEPVRERFAAVLFLTIPLLLPVTWPHYMVYLPFCQLLLVRLALSSSGAGRVRRISLVGMAVLSAALASVFLMFAFGTWIPYARSGALMWADLIVMIGLWIEAGPALLRPPHRARREPMGDGGRG